MVYNPKVSVTLQISGQILDYGFKTSNPSSADGKLKSETYITRTVVNPSGVSVTKTEAYRWTIKVKKGEYSVQTRGPDNDDPFPNTIPFSEAAVQRINTRGFNRKLWSSGKGIVVELVEHNSNYGANPTAFVPLNKFAAKNKNLYEPTDESCIDMMFTVGVASWPGSFPPETLQELETYVAQSGEAPGYCLGRCWRPLLVNTGF